MADQRFTRLGATRKDLEAAWQDRMKDAELLLAGGRAAAAIANALYALEILLKVLICRKLDLQQLPRAFEIHDVDSLLLLAGLRQGIKKVPKVRHRWDQLQAVAQQLNELRYLPDRNWTVKEATRLLGYLKDRPDGVLPWLLTVK